MGLRFTNVIRKEYSSDKNQKKAASGSVADEDYLRAAFNGVGVAKIRI